MKETSMTCSGVVFELFLKYVHTQFSTTLRWKAPAHSPLQLWMLHRRIWRQQQLKWQSK